MTSLVAESDRGLEPGRAARGKDRRDRAHQGGHEPYEAELHVGEVKIKRVAQQVGKGPAAPQRARAIPTIPPSTRPSAPITTAPTNTMRGRYQRRQPTARV